MDVITPEQQERRRRHFEREDEERLMKATSKAYKDNDMGKYHKLLHIGVSRFGWDVDNVPGPDSDPCLRD